MRKIQIVYDSKELEKELEIARAAGLKAPFSVSKIKLCDICRHKALMKYCYKLDGNYDPMTNIGSMFHKVMEDYGKFCVEHDVEYDADIAKSAVSRLRGDLSTEEWSNIKNSAMRYINSVRFPVRYGQVSIEDNIAVNRKWEPVGYDDPEAYFRGRMDLVVRNGRKATIWDYKTGYKVNALKNPITMFQLRSYAALYHANYPEVEEITVMNKHIRFSLDVGETISKVEMLGHREYVDDKISSIETDKEFAPVIQDHCQICAMSSACVAYQRYLNECSPNIINNIREAMEIAAKVYVTEAELKKLKSALKAYTQKIGGPIMVGTKDLAFAVQSSPAYDIDPIKAVKSMVKLGVPKDLIWQNMSISKTSLNEIMRSANMKDSIDQVLKESSNPTARSTTGFVNIGDPEIIAAESEQ